VRHGIFFICYETVKEISWDWVWWVVIALLVVAGAWKATERWRKKQEIKKSIIIKRKKVIVSR
jgi:uncharacterized membrane protein